MVDGDLRKSPRSPRRRLLAITGVSPWPPRGGFSLRTAHLLEFLAEWWEITLLVPASQELAAIPWTAADPHEVITVPMSCPWTPVPSDPADGHAFHDAVNAVLARRRFHAALLWPGTEFLAFERDGFPPAVADRTDCGTLERLRALYRWRATARQVVTSAAYERRLARDLAVTVVVGQDDARALRRISWSKNVVIVPNGVVPQDMPHFEAESRRPTVIFTGTLNYYANVDAVRHFARHIWPDIQRGMPDARLLIAGRTPSPRVLAFTRITGVEVRADVPDMVRVLQEAWVAVAPMRLGAGVKNKVLEAWAAGRPVVLTPVAANGLDMSEDTWRLVARRPGAFAGLVLQLLSDQTLRQSLGSSALSLVRARHSWRQSAHALSQLLLAVGESPWNPPRVIPSADGRHLGVGRKIIAGHRHAFLEAW
jgi:glycosyltransferase involved in cell wall biosynthesis